jgi:hypothetical protein
MTSQDKARFSVIGGPSKYDLLASLGEGHAHLRTVNFLLEGCKQEISVCVMALEKEDGSGESWNFKALLWNWKGDLGNHWRTEGFFSTKHRRGTLRFELMGGEEERKFELFFASLK